MSVADALLAALGTPRLDGALCRGRQELFDPPDADTPERAREMNQARALRLCGRCSALADCRRWLDGLPKAQRPTGVVAGRVNVPRVRERRSALRSRANTSTQARQYRRASVVNGGAR